MIADAKLEACETSDEDSTRAAVDGAAVVIAAGRRASSCCRKRFAANANQLKVAIDLNAVPPVGIGGIKPHDKAADQDGQICYGAIGVGGLKMKLHKAAIRRCSNRNDAVLDAEEIYALASDI